MKLHKGWTPMKLGWRIRALRPAAATALVTLGAALSACGSEDPAVAARPACGDARSAAVHLMLDNLNATALPGASDRRVLRARLQRFMARERLDARVVLVLKSIDKLGGGSYTQPWASSMTVGRWEACDRSGVDAAVVFVAYTTYARHKTTPLTRYTVTMRREHGTWKLVSYEQGWLTSAGPMGGSGKLEIRGFPERTVFRDPRPRA